MPPSYSRRCFEARLQATLAVATALLAGACAHEPEPCDGYVGAAAEACAADQQVNGATNRVAIADGEVVRGGFGGGHGYAWGHVGGLFRGFSLHGFGG